MYNICSTMYMSPFKKLGQNNTWVGISTVQTRLRRGPRSQESSGLLDLMIHSLIHVFVLVVLPVLLLLLPFLGYFK